MSIESDPEEYGLPPEKRMHKARPFVIVFLLLLIIGLLLCFMQGGGSGYSGNGPGSGIKGKGSGSGKSGRGTGSGKTGRGTGAGKQGTGIGSGPAASGKTSVNAKGRGSETVAAAIAAPENSKPKESPVNWKAAEKLLPEYENAYKEACTQIRALTVSPDQVYFPEAGAPGTSVNVESGTYLISGFFGVKGAKNRIFTFRARINKVSHILEDHAIAEKK